MRLIYSALQNQMLPQKTEELLGLEMISTEPLIRYLAYEAACNKLQNEIIAIQKYTPGWMPAFR